MTGEPKKVQTLEKVVCFLTVVQCCTFLWGSECGNSIFVVRPFLGPFGWICQGLLESEKSRPKLSRVESIVLLHGVSSCCCLISVRVQLASVNACGGSSIQDQVGCFLGRFVSSNHRLFKAP